MFYGTNERTVEYNRTFITSLPEEARWERETFTRQSRYTKRNFMDTSHRSTMERSSWEISTIPDMPSTLPVLGTKWSIRQNTYYSGNRLERTWEDRRYRVFHRWHLCGCQKRGLGIGKTKRGKGSKIMAIADSSGLPIAISVTSASPHEITLVENTLNSLFIDETPKLLIGDKAYDSDKLDKQLKESHDVELVAPHKANRKKASTQDGRILRRYSRRWKVERLFAWCRSLDFI